MTGSTDGNGKREAQTLEPREGLRRAVELTGQVVAGVRADQYDASTPCPEYSVRDLCNHVVAILRRVSVIGRGGSFADVPHFAPDVEDGEWKTAWDAAAREADEVWSDPAVLGREIGLPWGAVPGAVAAVIYTNEFVLHAWDLATATDQEPEWPAEVLAAPLANMRRAVPAEPREAPVPFGPVVEVSEDAPDIDRLVAWYGRRPR